MAVPEQMPIVSYIANGTTTNFGITFDLHDDRYLVVTVNKEIPPLGSYTVSNHNTVIFSTAPNNGDEITLARETVLNRDTNYKSYDNSFRPETLNYDFDKIWHALQEQNLIDAELLARLKTEIEWRRTHDANFDELAKMRDAQVFSGLLGYVNTYIAATNPNIFEGVTAGVVFALDKKSVQTHLEIIYQQLADNRQSITAEVQRATGVEAGIQAQVNALGGGSGKAYKTYADMVADKANIAINSIVTVTNDPDPTKNYDYQYDGVNFTKSSYDPVKLAEEFTKSYVSANALALKPNLVDENLNAITALGYYRQVDNTKATIANNYPTDINGAGVLEVINNNGLVIQEYTTWYNRKFRRTKYGSFDFLAWQELPNAADIVMYYKPNLGTEDLDTVLTSGIYRQLDDAKATAGSHYPTTINGAGILDIINRNNLVIQQYTTWFGLRYWRTKYSTYAFGAWQKYATLADMANAISIKTPLLTTEDLDTLTTVGIYRQQQDSNATVARNYPNVQNPAGVLEVINHNGLIIQEYTTWYSQKFWRTKYSTYAFGAWKEIANIESINSPYKGKTIAVFGDSLIEPSGAYPVRVAAALGATLLKFGFASHTMSKYQGSPLGRDKGSMYRFAKAINSGDWTDVIAGGEWVRDNLADDNMPQINAMVATDWTKVDYIVIAFGTNDIYSATPLGDSYVADPNGETFKGALCYSIEQIQAKYPHIQIMFVTPTFRTRWFYPDRPEQNSDTLPDPEGKPYTAYIDALSEMRNKYHLPVFDFYRTSGINSQTFLTYLSDGVHPNTKGTELFAKKFQAFLLAN